MHIQLCLTFCDPVDCNPPDSSVLGILQVRILEWVAISSSRGSSWLRDWTHISCDFCIAGRFFTHWATWEALTLDTFIAMLWVSLQLHLTCLHANTHLSILLLFFAQAFLYFHIFAHPVALLEMWTASRSTHSLGFSFQLDPPGLFWLILL